MIDRSPNSRDPQQMLGEVQPLAKPRGRSLIVGGMVGAVGTRREAV